MPSSYSGVNVYPASFQIPSDGDLRNASSVNAGLEALGDRTAYLLNRFNSRLVLYSEGHIQAPASFSWPNTTGAFVVSEQAPLKDISNTNTPWTSDILANDVIELDFCMNVLITSAAAGNQFQWQFRLVYSESASDFVSGTWSDPVGSSMNTRTVMGVASATYPTILTIPWSVKLTTTGSSGHLRFAIQASRFGDETADLASYSAGRWRQQRIMSAI